MPHNTKPKHNLKKHQSAISKAFDEMFSKTPEDDESENCLLPEDSGSVHENYERPDGRIPDFTSKIHECEEGMTELDGYFICKYCGTNLRKIK